MKRSMSHDEAREELGAAALDALPADERAAVLEHVVGCVECRAELVAYDEVTAYLAEAAPAAPLAADRGARIRARLVARAGADRAASGAGAAGPASLRAEPAPPSAPAASPAPGARPERAVERARRRWGMATWLAAAASIAFLAAAVGLARVTRERDTLRTALQATEQRDARRADSLGVLAAAVAQQRRTLEGLTGPSVHVMELTAAGAREPMARMFWDQASNRWTMIAHRMPKPPAGKTYQLWLVTTSATRISAGTFEPTPAGDVMMTAEYPLAPNALQAIAVTEEPAGGMPQPTGPMVIVGTVGRNRG
jgi:anti-sigma-K factor RskA